MTIKAETLLSLFNDVRQWLNKSDLKQQQEKAKLRAALRAIYIAASETKRYLDVLEDANSQRDPQTEANLSRFWEDASAELSEIDASLAQRCMLGADHWADRSGWTQQQIASSRTNVNNAVNIARNILINTHGADDGGKD